MPYKCVHCSKVYKDGSDEILTGCTCSSKFFFYVKESKLKEILDNQKEEELELDSVEAKRIEKDLREIAGIQDPDEPVFLDFESIKVLKSGKYLIDLTKLFASNSPRVYQIEDGKYVLDLDPKSTMKK